MSDSSDPGGQGASAKKRAIAVIDPRDFRVAELSSRDVHEMTVESLDLLRGVVAFSAGTTQQRMRFAQTRVTAAAAILRWAMWATERHDAQQPSRDRAFLDLFESPEDATRWLSENADRLQRDLASVTRPPVAHSSTETIPDEAESRRQEQAHGEHSKDGR